MRTILTLCAIFAAVNAAFAEHTPVHPSKMEQYIQKTGGVIDPPADSRKLVVLDARVECKIAFTNNLRAASRFMEFGYVVKETTLKNGESPLDMAREERKNGAGAVVFYCEDKTMPTLSVYPEEAIVVLNVKPLFDKDELVFQRRLNKEFWRALAFALGGYGGTTQGPTVLAPVFTLNDLDALRASSLSPTQLGSVNLAKSKLRIYGTRQVPYSRACREGWAPAPTNDVQRAVWNKIYAMPKTPMKIEFDPKKGR